MVKVEPGRLREPAAWIMLALVCAEVLIAVVRLLFTSVTFGDWSVYTFTSLTSPVHTALALGAFFLATRFGPPAPRARLIHLGVIGVLGASALIGVVTLFGTLIGGGSIWVNAFSWVLTGVPGLLLSVLALLYALSVLPPAAPRPPRTPATAGFTPGMGAPHGPPPGGQMGSPQMGGPQGQQMGGPQMAGAQAAGPQVPGPQMVGQQMPGQQVSNPQLPNPQMPGPQMSGPQAFGTPPGYAEHPTPGGPQQFGGPQFPSPAEPHPYVAADQQPPQSDSYSPQHSQPLEFPPALYPAGGPQGESTDPQIPGSYAQQQAGTAYPSSGGGAFGTPPDAFTTGARQALPHSGQADQPPAYGQTGPQAPFSDQLAYGQSGPQLSPLDSSYGQSGPQVTPLDSSYGQSGPQVTPLDSSYGQSGPQVSPLDSSYGQTAPQLSPLDQPGYGQTGSQVSPLDQQQPGYGQSGPQVTPLDSTYGQSGSQVSPLDSSYGQQAAPVDQPQYGQSGPQVSPLDSSYGQTGPQASPLDQPGYAGGYPQGGEQFGGGYPTGEHGRPSEASPLYADGSDARAQQIAQAYQQAQNYQAQGGRAEQGSGGHGGETTGTQPVRTPDYASGYGNPFGHPQAPIDTGTYQSRADSVYGTPEPSYPAPAEPQPYPQPIPGWEEAPAERTVRFEQKAFQDDPLNAPLPSALPPSAPQPRRGDAIDPTAIYAPDRTPQATPEESPGRDQAQSGADQGAPWYGSDR
ncbi:hypothetical protein [Sphaerisporangium aureirubrum]|uniref:Uncharacterized protein n=1 Tax=Sphaerisporangium aureirubrum TaxID=1544736 RepID=A0ABW1NEB8_9ACTN